MTTEPSNFEIGDALQFPNDRALSHILLNMLTDPAIAKLVRSAMERSNVAEVRAALDALSITDRLRTLPALPSHGTLDNRREVTRFTPFLSTDADNENIDTIKDHLNLKHLSDAIRAALMIYAMLIRAGVFHPEPEEG